VKKIILTHTSREIMKHPDSLIPVLFGFQLVTGQKPKKICAKKSVSNWQLREDQIMGCQTTLRNELMYSFLEKLIFFCIPNMEENDIQKKLNHNEFVFGIKNFSSFFEIENQLDFFRQSFPNWNHFGCHVQIITSCESEEETKALLKGIMFPIK